MAWKFAQPSLSFKVIVILALSSFCMGVTEFVIAGVLLDVQEFFGIDAHKAGYLTTAYALGVVVGAPLVTIPLSAFHRKIQLLLNLGVFGAANFVLYVSDDFTLSVLARFVAGTQHGVFFVIATLTALQVSPKGRESHNLALMVSGLTIALVSGVPLGTFIGEAYGFKAIFLLIFVFTSIAFCSALIFMPNTLKSQQIRFIYVVEALRVPPLLKAYLITICTCGGAFVLYTYLGELLIKAMGFSAQAMGFILLAYGGCAILGNLFGGRLADSCGSVRALKLVISAQILIYALVSVSYHWDWLVVVNLCCMGFVAFAGIPALKMNAMNVAKKHTPSFMDSSISVNEAAFNVGIALANQIGGLVVVAPLLGISYNPLFAALFATPALLALLLTRPNA
ncbi:MFS transporter [uncultured Helicobacter sp.]|uniref:MFS transporter n=1 Tax=uncultured Helicobacter sp. TaxID=175537 RepID=UPI003753D4D9